MCGVAHPIDPPRKGSRGLPTLGRAPDASAPPRVASHSRNRRKRHSQRGILPTHNPANVGQLVPRQPGFPLLVGLSEKPIRVRATEFAHDPRLCIPDSLTVPTQPAFFFKFAKAHGIAGHAIDTRIRSAACVVDRDYGQIMAPPTLVLVQGSKPHGQARTIGANRRAKESATMPRLNTVCMVAIRFGMRHSGHLRCGRL